MNNEKSLSLGRKKFVPALLLDWDGTIRKSKTGGYIKNFSDIELMPGIEKLIWLYRENGWLIVGISNQGGVAHGIKLPMEIEYERDVTLELFDKNPFHIVKMCYHMADGRIEPYNHRSLLRKPDIGMLAIAEMDAFAAGYVIDWDKSLFVGDRPEDAQCAANAGIKFEHIDSFLVSPKEFLITDGIATAIADKITDDVVNSNTEPSTLDEAIFKILPRFEGMEKNPHFEKGEDAFSSFCHSQLSGGIGMKIRNEFDLWSDSSVLHRHFVTEHGVKHPDDMSALIIRGVYRIMKEK